MQHIYYTIFFCSLVLTTKAQDLYINFDSGFTLLYGIGTIERITFSNTDMEIFLAGGSLFSYGMDSIKNYRYQPTVTSQKDITKIEQYGFNIYPNPTNDFIQVEVELDEVSILEIILYNATGKVMYRQSNRFGIGKNKELLNLKEIGLSTGVYFLELKTSKKRFIDKLIFNK